MVRPFPACVLLLLLLLGIPSCGVSGGGGNARLRSTVTGDVLAADLPRRAYAYVDANTADYYLTDLPPEVWTGGMDVSNLTGTIVHVHMFLSPKAGRTPIAQSASSATIRVMILAGGEIGVYGGGAFLVKKGTPGEKTLGGRIDSGSMRLVRATPGFSDLLGPSEFSGTFSAPLDPATAGAIGRVLSALGRHTEPVE